MEEEIFAPRCDYCFQPEYRTIGETLVKPNAGRAIPQINQAKLACQAEKVTPVFLIDNNLSNRCDGSIVGCRRFRKVWHRPRQTRLYVKRLDEIKRPGTGYTQVVADQ